MTIGEKIKYFRTRIGITQAKLAELSGIHPVSIRKYETNKMVPQSPQIDRIAEALGISSFAIAGIENNIRLETVGDFMGLMIMLIKTKIISLNGEREKNGMLNSQTVSVEINPFISNFFNAKNDSAEISANKIMYYLKSDKILSDIYRAKEYYPRILFVFSFIFSDRSAYFISSSSVNPTNLASS